MTNSSRSDTPLALGDLRKEIDRIDALEAESPRHTIWNGGILVISKFPLGGSHGVQWLGMVIPFGLVQDWLATAVQPLFAPETFTQLAYSPLLLQPVGLLHRLNQKKNRLHSTLSWPTQVQRRLTSSRSFVP